MAKGKLAVLMLAGIAVSALANNSRAAEANTADDGCALLAQLVYAEVTENAWYGPGRVAWSWPNPGEYRVAICNHTARAVSRAYTSAMAAMGEDISWGYSHSGHGDACLSGFLEQCYPERYPLSGAGAWSAVQTAVRQAMPQGTASDQSVFSTTAMRLALRASLAQPGTQR